MGLYISMYHYIRDLKHSRYPEIKGLDSELFEQQLEFFSKNFDVIKMEDLIEAINNGGSLPKKALLLTFDDGYIDNYLTVFPLLKRYGFQGSFFIPGRILTEKTLLDVNKIHFTLASAEIGDLVEDLDKLLRANKDKYDLNSPEELWNMYAKGNRFDDEKVIYFKRVLQSAIPESLRAEISSVLFDKYVGIKEDCFAGELYMNSDQIRLMKQDGMFFGVHGYSHCWLGSMPVEESRKDIDRALESLAEFIDPACWVMNYPYGSWNDGVIDYISKKGCTLGLSTEVRVVDIGVDNRYLLPRFDCNDFPPKSNNYEVKRNV